jgi:hypothetical protein
VIEFIIPKFIEGSPYFERHTAYHQELQTVFAASGLYINQRLQIRFGTPDDERYAARNMSSFQ